MNRTMRRVGLLMLGVTAACAVDMGPPPEAEPRPSVPKAASAPAPKQNAPLFSRTVREQLAARGIHVHGGPKPDGERTTVEQKWIVPGAPMTPVVATNPNTVPHKFATHLEVQWPHVTSGKTELRIDPARGGRTKNCSGTLVDTTAVLTAGHCVIDWKNIGTNPTTGAPQIEKMRAYSIAAYPRRNGSNRPYGPLYVQKSFWNLSDWPRSNRVYDADNDYAVVRLKKPAKDPIAATNLRIVDTPGGMIIRVAHYPFASQRGFGMYYSEGFVGDVHPLYTNTYNHQAGTEPGSSGAGMFEVMTDGLVGILVAEDPDKSARFPGQMRSGFPNQVLMLTEETMDDIMEWIIAPI
jgi:V8-like Glu-specific endopeptidase